MNASWLKSLKNTFVNHLMLWAGNKIFIIMNIILYLQLEETFLIHETMFEIDL